MNQNKKIVSWTERIYEFIGDNKLYCLITYTLSYTLLKVILLLLKESSLCDSEVFLCKYIIKPVGNDTLANMDILGYFIGIFTFYIGLKIAFQLDRENETKTDAIQDATTKIQQTTQEIKPITDDIRKATSAIVPITDEIKNATQEIGPATRQISKLTEELLDSMRKSLPSIPAILKEIQDILAHTKTSTQPSELFIMNRISEFGRIHTYNPRFAKEFKDDLPEFIEELNRSNALLMGCFRNPNVNSVLLTYENREKIEKFIDDYFGAEDEKNTLRLHVSNVYSDQHANNIEKKRKVMKEKILARHYEIIAEFRKTLNSEVKSATKEISNMIIYLAKYAEGNDPAVSRTLVVFSVDKKDNNENIQRQLFGLTSTTQTMYDVFRTYFD